MDTRILFFSCFFWLAPACAYDPPPSILEASPERGGILADGSRDLTVRFTEPVVEGSLEVFLARRLVDEEGRLLPICEAREKVDCTLPHTGPCTSAGPCPGGSLVLDADRTGFRLDPEDDLTVGEYVVRISAGLEDDSGNDTGIPYDIFFFISPTGTLGPTTFKPGVFITWAELDRPFSFPLDIYWHIQVDPETGTAWGGACDGDLINPDDERVYDHKIWQPLATLEAEGYKFVFEGLVQDARIQDDQGGLHDGWIFETQSFYIYADQPQVEVIDGRVSFSVYHDEGLGRDIVLGTIQSSETYIFDTPAHEHPHEASGSLFGYRLAEQETGDGEHWRLCADTDPETVTRP